MSRAKPYFQKVGARWYATFSSNINNSRAKSLFATARSTFEIQSVQNPICYFARCCQFKTGIQSLQKMMTVSRRFNCLLRSIVHMRWCAPSRTLYFTGFLKNVFFGLYGWILKYSWGGLGMSLGPPFSSIFWGSNVILPDAGFWILEIII